MSVSRKRKDSAPSLAYIAEGLRPLAVPIGDVTPDPRNARKHDDDNVSSIMESLRRYGQRRPLVALRDTGVVLVGNGRLEAARRLGWSHVAVVWVEDDSASATGYAIADNRTAELAEWDEDLLAELAAEVRRDDAELAEALLLDDLVDAPDSEPAAGGTLEFHVIVDLPSEAAQEAFYHRMNAEGRPCRLIVT